MGKVVNVTKKFNFKSETVILSLPCLYKFNKYLTGCIKIHTFHLKFRVRFLKTPIHCIVYWVDIEGCTVRLLVLFKILKIKGHLIDRYVQTC